jgi:peptide/nickel transport system substrate-binding protein
MAQAWEPRSLNPLLHIDYNAYELDNLVYSMLLEQDETGRLVPDLATNVPSLSNGQISANGRRIVYRLRRDVRWQDGRPLTSRDVVFTYGAIMNPRTAVPSLHTTSSSASRHLIATRSSFCSNAAFRRF